MQMTATAEDRSRLIARFELAALLKSMNNVLLLDEKEVWNRKEANFSMLPQVLESFLTTVSGAADIPATRMLGQSPKGLNATGESDLRNYYDKIAADQNTILGPSLAPLDACIQASALGSIPGDIFYQWKPLWQPTAKEAAEIEKAEADTLTAIVNSGTVPDAAMAKAQQNRMIESGRWPGLEKALEEAAAAGDLPSIETEPTAEEQAQLAAEAANDPAEPVPPVPVAKAANDKVRDELTPDERRGMLDRLWAYLVGEPDTKD